MEDKKVLTIQDISYVGQCSLTVALPIISACGIETVILPSAVLSTHTGGKFSGYTFRDLTDDIPGIMKHWMAQDLRFDCLYTGYLGSITQIDYVMDLYKNVIAPEGELIVDPAMADFGKLYYGFDIEYVEEMAKLCGKADIILPNITEAAMMTKSEICLMDHSEEYIIMLLEKLAALGSKTIVLKGISYSEDKIGIAVYNSDNKDLNYYFTERVKVTSHGTGDCFAAALTGAFIQGKSVYESAKIATDFVLESIKKTVGDDSHWYGVKFEKALPMLVKELNV